MYLPASHAQSTVLKFKKLIYVCYYTNPDNPINITKYVEIDKKGLVQVKLKNNNRSIDTAYLLTSNLINDLDFFFDGNKLLESFILKDNFRKGTYYDGELGYVSYIDEKDLVHSFIVIPPYTNTNLNYLLDQIIIRPSGGVYKNASLHNKPLEDKIIKCQNTCSYVSGVLDQTPVKITH